MMKQTLLALALTMTVAGPAMADEALAKSKNCMACHSVDKKVVGPAYKDVAKKFADLRSALLDAARTYHDEVAAGSFPAAEHSFES